MEFLKYWEEYKNKYGSANTTDKGTTHNYITSYYANEFNNIKDKDIVLIEIGMGDGACSLHLWRDWFTNARIVNIENDLIKAKYKVEGVENIFEDAYCKPTVDKFENNSVDYLIDDGSHILQHQLYCVTDWISKIKHGGKLIIEDIQNINHVEQFKKILCDNCTFKLFDTRHIHGRYDDLLIEITKS